MTRVLQLFPKHGLFVILRRVLNLTLIYCLTVLFWFRYVIECPNCAVIYRSRQYWYGNQDPVETVVRTEIQHIWPGVKPARDST